MPNKTREYLVNNGLAWGSVQATRYTHAVGVFLQENNLSEKAFSVYVIGSIGRGHKLVQILWREGGGDQYEVVLGTSPKGKQLHG